jgi:hypothetical protein
MNRPFPIRTLPSDYRWGGVQIGNSFNGMDENVPGYRLTKNREYDGIYRDAVNITAADAVALFSDGGE